MEAVQRHARHLRGGDLLHRRHPRSDARQVLAEVLRRKAKELEKMGAHFLAIKDMAGLCRPYAAQRAGQGAEGRDRHARSISTPTTPAASTPASVLARRRCRRGRRRSRDRLDDAARTSASRTSTPSSPRCSTRRATPGSTSTRSTSSPTTGSRCASSTRRSTPRRSAGSAEVYLHEMPGGQYTNLKEQAARMGLGHRWPEIARTYAEVNQLFGDIVKVTPELEGRRRHVHVPLHPRHQSAGRAESRAGLARLPRVGHRHAAGRARPTDGGWPAQVQKVVLGDRVPTTQRPGELATPVNLDETRAELRTTLGRPPTEDDLYSHLMYPQVFADFDQFVATYGDVSGLPTTAFFYGLSVGEEIEVEIDPRQGALHQADQHRRGRRAGTPQRLLRTQRHAPRVAGRRQVARAQERRHQTEGQPVRSAAGGRPDAGNDHRALPSASGRR